MTALIASKIELLPAPNAPQAQGNTLDRDQFGDAFLLNVAYPDKAKGQQVDFTFEVHVDRFSPAITLSARFTTEHDKEEQLRFASTIFDYNTKDGWVLIRYDAKIAEVSKPSSTLHLLIKNRTDA